MKKLFVKTFGCQMNVYDSERMKDVLAPTGYMPTDSLEDADMVILNTCHIREKASEKVFSDLGRLRKLKDRAAEQQNRQILIALLAAWHRQRARKLQGGLRGLIWSLDRKPITACLN